MMTLLENFHVAIDIPPVENVSHDPNAVYVLKLEGAPIDVARSRDAMELLFETAFRQERFDQNRGSK